MKALPSLLAFLFIASSTSVASGQGFNEAFFSSGNLRTPYGILKVETGKDPLKPTPADIRKMIRFPLGDKTKILPYPLVLDTLEYEQIKKGVEQRARALFELFYDLVIGDGKIIGSNPALTKEFFDDLFLMELLSIRYLRWLYDGKSKESINFFYGPDLIRAPSGEWLVLEDNVGNIGGLADVTAIQNLYDQQVLGKSVDASNSALKTFILELLRQHGLEESAASKVFALLSDEKASPQIDPLTLDLEDSRINDIIKQLKTPYSYISEVETNPTTLLTHLMAEGDPKKAFLNFGHLNTSANQLILEEAFRGKNNIWMRSPGTSALSNKALLEHMSHLIRFYLKEEPILESPETHNLIASRTKELLSFHEDIKKQFFQFPSQWVFKGCNSCQGSGVFIGRNLSDLHLDSLLKNLGDSHTFRMQTQGTRFYVAQRYIEPSEIPTAQDSSTAYKVDVRPITYVIGGQPHVIARPWGRALSNLGDGLNNVSRGAFELPIALVDCKEYLTRISKNP